MLHEIRKVGSWWGFFVAKQGEESHTSHCCKADVKNHHRTMKEPRPPLPSIMSFYPNNHPLNQLTSQPISKHTLRTYYGAVSRVSRDDT